MSERWNSCQRKRRYDRYKVADRAAAKANLRERSFDDMHPIHVYSCRFCGGFHIGHRKLR